jgi:hypothetical protein
VVGLGLWGAVVCSALACGVRSCVEPWPPGCSRVWCLGRGDTCIDAESKRRGKYGIFFGGKNSSNKFEIKIVGKKGISVVPWQKASLCALRPLCELTK